MEVSTENLSEKEKAGRPGRTQETGTRKKLTAHDESRDDENEQGESQTCRRISRIDEQSKTETAKNQVLGSKKIKLEPGHDQKSVRKRSRNQTSQQQSKEKI
jgi:hypothetical protein